MPRPRPTLCAPRLQTVETVVGELDGVKLLTHALPTAGVVYADVLLDIAKVPWEELPLLRLLSRMLDEVGTSDMDATALQRRIGARTGGLGPSLLFEQPVAPGGVVPDPLGIEAHLAVRGKATADKVEDLLELTHAILADAKLDSPSKAVEMLKESKTRLESAFISSGNSFAGLRLGARYSLKGAIAEQTQGVTYYAAVSEMLELAQSDWPSLLARLEKLRATLLAKDGLIINLTADPAALESSMPALQKFVAKLPETSAHPAAPAWRDVATLLADANEAHAITTQVNYVAAATPLYAPGEKCDGASYVVARYLSRGYLWDNVRVVGGAYGGGCSLNPNTGVLSFSSYRDPNLQGTVDIYAGTAKVLDELELSDEALEQAIVGAVGDLDSPMTSQSKGFRGLQHHITGVTTEIRQQFRDEVIATDRASFAAVAERLRGKALKVSVFGEQEALEKANAARGADEQIEVKPLK
jgi:Zn-dependent M16 (insulinase) family peptidase